MASAFSGSLIACTRPACASRQNRWIGVPTFKARPPALSNNRSTAWIAARRIFPEGEMSQWLILKEGMPYTENDANTDAMIRVETQIFEIDADDRRIGQPVARIAPVDMVIPAGGKATAPPPVRPSSLLGPVLVVAVAALCVRLGFWQISRLHEKQALNTGLRSELAGRPIPLGEISAPVDSLRGRKLEMRGRFDERRQILLAGRAHDGAPGVDVVTPLLLGDGTHAVLVDRGWLYAPDAATARPRDYPEPGEREVTGLADPLRRGAGGPSLRAMSGDSVQLLSARWLDLDSLAPRFPYALAPVVLR